MSDEWTVEVLHEGTSYSSTCTLVRNSVHRALVDTGLSIQEGELVAALHTKGLEPADIDLVINTHLHVDHCGNNAIFSRASIFLSQPEWRWTQAFYAALFASRTPERVVTEFYPEMASYALKTRTIRNVARIARLVWDPGRVGREEQFRWLETWDLPAGLGVLPSPGHTPHHISIRVDAPTPVIIAGDAVLAEDTEVKVRTMIPYSRAQFLATRQALLECADMIVPGHGPAFSPRPLGVRSA